MIKRLIRSHAMTLAKAKNLYSQSTPIIALNDLNTSLHFSDLYHTYVHSCSYAHYLCVSRQQLSDMAQNLNALSMERLGSIYSENPGIEFFKKRVNTMVAIESIDDSGYCVLLQRGNVNVQTFTDMLELDPSYFWMRDHYRSIPNGNELFADLIAKLKRAFEGKLAGRQPWHKKQSDDGTLPLF